MTGNERWADIDHYLVDLLVPRDAALEGTISASDAAGLPPVNVPATQGKFLMLLAETVGAQRILEIGTLGAYSTIWLARGLAAGGRLVTLESEAMHAAVARANLNRAGLSNVVDLRLGPALETLPALVTEGQGPFDLIFLDADRPRYDEYFPWMLRLSRPGTLIVADNVVRGGAVTDAGTRDAQIQGVRKFLQVVAADPRVSATAIQTVSGKGHDGFALIRVRSLAS